MNTLYIKLKMVCFNIFCYKSNSIRCKKKETSI